MSRFHHKWVSTVLIAAILATLVVIPERQAFADDRPDVEIVAVLVESGILSDTAAIAVRDDLREEFPGDMHNISLAARVRRYADDIQQKLPMSKVLIVPVGADEDPWKIQESLAKLYVEGDGTTSAKTKLKGIVLIGGVPLPLVTKDGRSYVSLYPYTDFEDPVFTYDFARQEFVSRETEGRGQPEVWHGVIPYPVSWEQFIREQAREDELSKIRRERGVDAYTEKLEQLRSEYAKISQGELAHYFDKNHSFYSKGAYSEFSKKAVIMDFFREFQAVSAFALSGYQAYLDNWDNKSYMRYTREWLGKLQDKYFTTANTAIVEDFGTNPDGTKKTVEQAIVDAKKDIENNPRLNAAEKERQSRLVEENLRQSERLNAALSTKATAHIPDIFTRDPIEQFLHTASEVFGTVVGDHIQNFVNTGRWSMVGASGNREGHTIYKLVEALDETARKQILEVNTALENEVDTMLQSAAEKSFHMQVDLPSAPINYFGRFTSFLYSSPAGGFTNWGDNLNQLFGQTKYKAGHAFYIDVTPSPPLNTPLFYRPDNVEFLGEVENPANSAKYIPYTGQKYTTIVHHISPDKAVDVALMMYCTLSGDTGDQYRENCANILFDNPTPTQLKFLQLEDPKQNPGLSDGQRLEVTRYENTIKLQAYIRETSKPDAAYVGKEVVALGNNDLNNKYAEFLKGSKPLNWDLFVDTLQKHEEHLHYWNKANIDFKVVLHVVDLPFSAQQCTIYIGGAPETSVSGDTSYPLYLRGQTQTSAARQEANTLSTPAENNKNSTNLQNTTAWRQAKVQQQVTLALSSQEKRIRSKEMDIRVVEANPPTGDDPDGSRRRAWEEYLRKLKEERSDMVSVKNYASSLYTSIWGTYYGLNEGDTGRFGDYLSHVGTLGEQTDLAKLVEANRLYNFSQEAIVQDVIEGDNVLQAIDPATAIDPAWYGYGEDIMRDQTRRPIAMSFPDWGDMLRHGYWGGCSAPNLRRVEDTATKMPFTAQRQEMQGVFDKVRDRHIANLKSKNQGVVGVLKYIVPPLGALMAFLDYTESQSYYLAVVENNLQLFNILMDKMLMDDAYQPSMESTDPIEASVASFKQILSLERDTLLGDMSEADYNAIKPDLRAILKKGSERIIQIEKLYQESLASKSAKNLRLNPADFRIQAPVQNLSISDKTTRDAARQAVYDLVQGEYDIRLLETGKIQPDSRQTLNSFAARVLQTVSTVTSAIDGEFVQILATTTIADALTFIGLTCDPQRALEPIFDAAGAKTLTDPGYLPLRTEDNTVKIRDANTLSPQVTYGQETWEKPGQPPLLFPKLRDVYTAPGQDPAQATALGQPTWKNPTLEETLVVRPSLEREVVRQVYRDDYPRTRDEVLFSADSIENSYAEGWEYTRKGYNITVDEAQGTEKAINEGLPPETSYLACLRYAKFGIEATTPEEENPVQGLANDKDAASEPYYGNQYERSTQGTANNPAPEKRTISDLDAERVSGASNRPSGWKVVQNLFANAASDGFSFKGYEKNISQFLREFGRMTDSTAGNFRAFPLAKDELDVESRLPLKYTGKLDYQFDLFVSQQTKLEDFFQKAVNSVYDNSDNNNFVLRLMTFFNIHATTADTAKMVAELRSDNATVDYNDPEKRRELYSIYGVRRIATVIPHKEPTNETIARQLRSLNATSLPVNNPRYVDFYLYEPIPQFNNFGEVEKWNEYEEHISIPYINFFRAFPDDKRFAYAMQQDRSQFKTDISAVEERLSGIVTGMNNYLVDYLAKTSLSGPSAQIAAEQFRLDLSSIGNERVRRDFEGVMNGVLSGLSQGAKTPQELQALLQGSLGGVSSSSALKQTALEGVHFDTARFEQVLRTTSLASGNSDAEKAASAKKELAFAVYWQHMTLAEKYKFVMHNYLTSSPDPEVTRMSFWQDEKVGFEAGTIILESDTASKAQLPLETLQGGRATGALSAPTTTLAPTAIPDQRTRCEDVYREEGGNKYGVPIQGWGRAISCWATNLWPLMDFSDTNSVNLETWAEQVDLQKNRFAEDTGRFIESLDKTKDILWHGAGAAVQAVGAGLDAAGTWLQDMDQDGLSTAFEPVDTDAFNPDRENSLGELKPNGIRDGQDRVKKLLMYSRDNVITVVGKAIVVPPNEKEGVIPYGAGSPLEVHVALADAQGRPLLANNFDFIRLDIVEEDRASSVVTIPAGEALQRAQNGVATFKVFPKNAATSFGKTRLKATLMRQTLPNSPYVPEAVADVIGEYTVTVTPEVLGALLTRMPCTPQERATATCARGDVRDAQVDSIFSTNETAHQLSLVSVDMSRKNALVERTGKLQIAYYKDGLEKKHLYTKAMGGRESLEVTLDKGAYAAVYAVPKESGKYFVTITPEASLGLAPTTMSFLVVDTTYSTMRLEVDPPVAVEGQTVNVRPVFTNLAGEEITLGLGQASIGIPRNTPFPLDLTTINARDGLPGGDTEGHYSIDVVAGKNDALVLPLPETEGAQRSPYTLDLLLSRIAPLSQITQQAGSDAEAEAQRLLVRTPLLVYPKGSLQIRAALEDGSSALSIPAITAADQECRINTEVNAGRIFTVNIELRDSDGRLVPYNGSLLTAPDDLSLFSALPATVTLRGGKGTLSVTPSRKAGTTKLFFKDTNGSFAESSITLTLTPGPLAGLRFTTQNIRPLEAAAEKNSTPTADTMQALRYVGLDICGNPVSASDTTTIALDLQPPRGDGTLVELLPLGVDGGAGALATANVTYGSAEQTLQTQKLDAGRNGVVMQAVNFRGEASLTVRALTTNAAGKTVIDERITPDTVQVPIRMTLRKELIQSLEPNILYTNLLGGPYGDVTQKDFLGGWWMLTGKTQVVTTSTVASEVPTNLAKVLPNGAIDIQARSAPGVNIRMFAEPQMDTNMPFTVNVKDASDGVTVMQVRYNIIPFVSGAVFESYKEEVTVDRSNSLAPGIYIIPDEGVTTRKDLLAQNRSVVRFFKESARGTSEEAILADNMQMFPGGGKDEMPLVVMDTERRDIIALRLNGAAGEPLASIYVKLDEQRVFPADGDYKRDVQLSLDAVREKAIASGTAQITDGLLTLADTTKQTLEEARRLSPTLVDGAAGAIRYVRDTLGALEVIDSSLNGIFTRKAETSLLRLVSDGDAAGLYIADRLLFPFRNLATAFARTQEWIGANTLRYQLELSDTAQRIHAVFASANGGQKIMATMTPVYGAEPLSWSAATTRPVTTGWYQTATQSGPYTYSTQDNGLIARANRVEDIPGNRTARSMPQCTSTGAIPVAGISPSGESWSCFEALTWEKSLTTTDGKARIVYLLRESTGTTNRILTEGYIHFGSDRAIPSYSITEATRSLITEAHQGVYIEIKDAGHLWNAEVGKIVRRDPMPGSTTGLVPILSLTPTDFLQLPADILSSGLYRTRLENATKYPTLSLEELKNGTWTVVATLVLQLHEQPMVVRAIAAANAQQERPKVAVGEARVFFADANISLREEGTQARVLNGTTEILRFERAPFRILSLGAGLQPELLETAHDRFQLRLRSANGTELLTLDVQTDARYASIKRLSTGSSLPQALLAVPGLYIQERDPLLVMEHARDRTLSRLMFGFEEVMLINKTGGMRVVRSDLIRSAYTPSATANQFISFAVQMLGLDAMTVSYSMAGLPFDLRVLAYLQESRMPALETREVPSAAHILRPAVSQISTGVLKLVGPFLNLRDVPAALAERNNQMTNTTLSLPVSLTANGFPEAVLRMSRRDSDQSQEILRSAFVAQEAPKQVALLTNEQAQTQAIQNLAVIVQNTAQSETCARTDTVTLGGNARTLLTCRDAEGVRIREGNTTLALIRHDGAFRVFDPAFSIKTRITTADTVKIFYSLASADGSATYLLDIVAAGSPELAGHVRRGSPETTLSTLAGTYVSYVAKAADSKAGYPLMEALPGVPQSTEALMYCNDLQRPAATCQPQLQFGASSFLRSPDNRFSWQQENNMKDADGYTFPAFGYFFQPTATRIATIVPVLRDTPLRTGEGANVHFTAANGALVEKTATAVSLKRQDRNILSVNVLTGAISGSATMTALTWTPEEIHLALRDGQDDVGRLSIKRSYLNAPVIETQTTPASGAKAGLHVYGVQNTLQVHHNFPEQSSRVALGYDTLVTLKQDGGVELGLPAMLRTLLPEAKDDPLRLVLNVANGSIDVGTSLVAFPLTEIAQKLRDANTMVASSSLLTAPFMRTVVDRFGNLVTEGGLQRKSTTEREQNVQTRPVYAPTKPQVIFAPQISTLGKPTLPTFQLNPAGFFNAVSNENYSVVERDGDLYFMAPSAHSYWTGIFGADQACSVNMQGGGVAAVLLSDGTRVLCDPLHTMDVRFDTNLQHFIYALRTKQTRNGVSSVIGEIAMYPGEMNRMRLLMEKNNYASEDVANNFAHQGLYGAIAEDYTFDTAALQLRLAKGDTAPVWSAASANLGRILTNTKVWNNSQDRFYVNFDTDTTEGMSFVQRRIPLAWKIFERREVRFTEQGSEPWSGDMLAATMRMTLTDPAVVTETQTASHTQNQPSFVCSPLTTNVVCSTDQQGTLHIEQTENLGTPAANTAVSLIPALVFQKENAAKWSETGLWSGSVQADTGAASGIARIELFNKSGEIQAVVQYRPAMQYAAPRMTLVQPGANAPVLSLSQPEVQVLLARPGVRLFEKDTYFVLSVEERVQEGAEMLMHLQLKGALAQPGVRLQNADVLSFDGTKVQSVASIGQFGLGIVKDAMGMQWTIGDIATLMLSRNNWTLRSFAEMETGTGTLARGESTVEALQSSVILEQSEGAIQVSHNTSEKTLAAVVTANATGAVVLRGEALMQKQIVTPEVIETYIVEQRPLDALIRIAANPRMLSGNTTASPFTRVSLLPANTVSPSLEEPGSAFIQALSTTVRLVDGETQVLVEEFVAGSWQRRATVEKKTLKTSLVDSAALMSWERRSANLLEIFVQDVTKTSLARVRQQNTMPDLTRTAFALADFPAGAVSQPVVTLLADSATRVIQRGAAGSILLYTNRLIATPGADGVQIRATNAADTAPSADITRQEKKTRVMTITPDRMLVNTFDANTYQIIPETLLPSLQEYTIYPARSALPADALVKISRYQPMSERYSVVTPRTESAALTAVARPGIVMAEQKSPVTLLVATQENTTKVRYGYDEIGSINAQGEIQAISPAWEMLVQTAKSLRSRVEGTVVEFLGVPYLKHMVRRHTNGYSNAGVRNTIFVEMVSKLGSTDIDLELAADRPSALRLGQEVIRWNTQQVAQILSPIAQYVHEASESALLKFTVQTASRPIASLFIQTVADTSAQDAVQDADDLGNLPVDQITNTLEVLGGTGIYVQIQAPEKGALSLAYEPYGDSTNNIFAVALRDASMPLLAQNQINPTTTGVEDVLEQDGAGFGYTGDFKNMLLFAGGNTVGESTLPYMSEVLINLGDPVIALQVEEADRDNESFTSDIGSLIYTHTTGQIQQMVLYDIDKDGRKDIVFTDGDGKLQVVRNAGGQPVQWKYTGAAFEIPEGVRELLVRQVNHQDELAVTLGRPGTSVARTVKDGVTSVTAMDASFVELKNKGDALLERCKTRIPDMGRIESSVFGDIDGDGTDDMVVITNKNEIKTVRIDTTVDCDTQDPAKQRYTVTTVDTIGMKLDGAPLAAPIGNVPQGYHVLADGDVYARFNGPFIQTWNPLQSVCPQVDPRTATPVYPQQQVPTTLPANPEMVFIPEPVGPAQKTPSGNDPISAALLEAQNNMAGSAGVYFSYEGGERLMRMLVAADLPYIRSGGASLTRYEAGFQALAKSNPFSCIAGEGAGLGSFMAGLSSVISGATGFLTGPMKTVAMSQEAAAAANPTSTLYTKKYAKDLNGGIIQAGDTIAYVITMTNNLGTTKNVDIADRFQQGTDLLRGSVVCQKGTQRLQCAAQDSGGMFGLYVPNIEIRSGETLTITYQTTVSQSPIPLTLQLLDFETVREMVEQNIFSPARQTGLKELIAGAGNTMRKLITVSTPSMAQRGSFIYWRNADSTYGADILKPPAKSHPILQMPVIGPLLESLGLIWNEDGSVAKGAMSGGTDMAQKSTQKLNNLLLNAFMAADRDLDGLIDLWDEDITASPLQNSSLPQLAGTVGAGQLVRDAADDLWKGSSTFMSKFDQSLDAVAANIGQNDCRTAGCGLVPSYMNTAFFAPQHGSQAGIDALMADASIDNVIMSGAKEILSGVADAIDWPAFAAPMVTPPWVWPVVPLVDEMKTVSQFRLYFTVTLSGRFALTACAGPYHLGMVELPVPTGLEFNKNCYSYVLPDLLNIQQLCQDIADGLSGLIAGLGRTLSSGGYTVARMQKSGSVAGYAETEANAAFIADQFVFETDKFKNPVSNTDPSMAGALDDTGKAVTSFLKDFRQLGRGLSTAIPINSRTPGFPAFIIDWVERQIHEVLAKLLKLPTITLILPDPTLGFTRPADPELQNTTYADRLATCTEEAAQRGEECVMTIMDRVGQKTQELSTALKDGKTEAELRRAKEAEEENKRLLDECNSAGGKELCSSKEELNKAIARLDAAAEVNLPVLPTADAGLPSRQAISQANNALLENLEQARTRLAALPDSQTKTDLAARLQTLEDATFNDMSAQVVVLLTDTKILLADLSNAVNPEGFHNAQLRSYLQLKNTQDQREALAKCNTSDPIACSMQNAEHTYSQFMNGIDLSTGASIADYTGIFDVGVSSDQLLRKEVAGFSEILGIIGSLPFVSIRMRDVVFNYPWLPPDRISESLFHLESVKNQSLSSFHNFYKPAAACFYETDAQGNTEWNPMLPPSFTVRNNLPTANASSALTGAASNHVTMEYCLAAARVGQDAWAGLQGIENNINRIKQYGDIMNSLKQYVQWKTYVVGRLLNLVTGVVGQISGYVRDQNMILASWRDTIRSISHAIQSFQVIVDIFGDFSSQCTGCSNQRGTMASSIMDLLGNFIHLDVVAFPKWPDVEIDLSEINFRYDVVIPNIRLVPREFTLPRMSPINVPDLRGLPKSQLDLYANQGLNFAMPLLPALPVLPMLPELPAFRFPKLPDLPPPPKVPQLNAQVRLMVQTIAKIINIICLVQRNVLPISEGRVRSHLEAITASSVIWKGKTATTPTYEPTLDRIRLSTQFNVRLDSNRPLGQDTYMYLFDEAAKWWNNQLGSLVLSVNTSVADIPTKMFGVAAGFVNQEVLGKSMEAINKAIAEGGRTLQSTLQDKVSIPVQDFQAAVRESVAKKEAELRASQRVSSAEPAKDQLSEQREMIATASQDDPATMYIVDQLIGLQASLISTTAEAGLTDAASFIPDLEAQIAFLQSEEAGLPQDIRHTAVSRLQGIVDNARKPQFSPVQDADIEALPYIQGWRSLEQELGTEQQLLAEAEVHAGKLTEARTIEEFQSALSHLGMLGEEQFSDRPIASLTVQDSQNTESQRILDTLASEIAREVPMDVRDISTKKSITRERSLLAHSPEVGETGEPVVSNVDLSGAARAVTALAQGSGVVTGPAVTTAPDPVSLSRENNVALGVEEEGAILVQLPNNGGLITLTNYVPPAGLPVQIAMAPLSGRAEYPDIVYTVGSDIFIKYNQYQKSGDTVARYNGADRIREVAGLSAIMPALPAVMSPRVIDVQNNSVSLRFDLPARTRLLDASGHFTGDEARYALRVYNRLEGRVLGETPTEFIILPVNAVQLSMNGAALTSVLQKNDEAMPENIRDYLSKEALAQGLPSQRILLGAVTGSTVQVTLPITNRNAPLFMTIVPRVMTDDGYKTGLPSKQLFAHPQIGLDTTPPVITVTGGETQIVPLEEPLNLDAIAEDAVNNVVELWWDTDTLQDSDLDGNTSNDRDLVCSEATPCTIPLTTTSQGSTADTPALSAPTLKKTWQPGDRGLHRFRLYAKDALGNVASREVRIDVQPTEIRLEEYDELSGVLKGSIFPPQPNKVLQLLRVRDDEVSTLNTPLEVVTDGSGRFVIEGLLPGEGTALYDAAGSVMQE